MTVIFRDFVSFNQYALISVSSLEFLWGLPSWRHTGKSFIGIKFQRQRRIVFDSGPPDGRARHPPLVVLRWCSQ